VSEAESARNRTQSKVRTKVEHMLLVTKRIFEWAKVRAGGLAKNTYWIWVACDWANFYVARRRLLTVVSPVGKGPAPVGRPTADESQRPFPDVLLPILIRLDDRLQNRFLSTNVNSSDLP
jgi:hypothetical protein